MDSKEILEAQFENHQEPTPDEVSLPFKVGDWVTCEGASPMKYHVSSLIDGATFMTDKFLKDGVVTDLDQRWNYREGEWGFYPVDGPAVKPDSLDVKLFSVHRSASSKGYEVALFPGAPFGPEVVLSLRERGDLEVEVAVETPDSKPAFLSLVMGSVTVLMDLHTAEEIASALYYHGISENSEETIND